MSISLYRSVAQQYAQICTVNTVPAMNAISRVIEEQVIAHELAVNFYAGFQRFSTFVVKQKRYARLGAVCRRVYVFGVADIPAPRIPGVEFIALTPDDALAQEWFLHIDAPELWTALVTREEQGRDPITDGRRFAGLWSFDSAIAERISLLISQQLGTAYQPVRGRNLATQAQHIAEISAALVGIMERRRLGERRQLARVRALEAFAATAARQHNGQRIGEVPVFLLRDLVQQLTVLFEASEVAVAFAAQHEGEFHVVATDERTVPGTMLLRAGEGVSGRAISEGVPVIVNDLPRSGEREPLLPGSASVLAAPILGRSRVHGVIAVSSPQRDGFEAADGQALAAIADMLALAVERAGEIPAARVEAESNRRFAQLIVRLRDAAQRMADLPERMEAAGPLNERQRAILLSQSRLATEMAQALGITRSLEVSR